MYGHLDAIYSYFILTIYNTTTGVNNIVNHMFTAIFGILSSIL